MKNNVLFQNSFTDSDVCDNEVIFKGNKMYILMLSNKNIIW
jgi:hypothetical protein